MRTTPIEPVHPRWSTSPEPTATAAQLVTSLGRFELAELEPWRAELRDAVDELAAVAGRRWHLDGDATIALVRAAAVLARRAPHAAGPRTALLVAALGG